MINIQETLCRPNMVVLLGRTGAGKDSYYRQLCSEIQGAQPIRVSFGDLLRQDTEKATGVVYTGHPDDRDDWERRTGFKYSMVLTAQQTLAVDPWRYIRSMLDQIAAAGTRLMVCTDCRSVNEYRALLSMCNVWVIRVQHQDNPHPVGPLDGSLGWVQEHLRFDGGLTDDRLPGFVNVLRMIPHTSQQSAN